MQFLLFFTYLHAKDKTESNKKEDLHVTTSKDSNSCIECHKKQKGKLRSVVFEWELSVHAKKGNKCNICHGGNPNVLDGALSKSTQYHFIGKPKKKEISDFCGRRDCHSRAFYQFKKSPHYTSVMESGEPNCASCHGRHNIQQSSVHIMSDETCSNCHSVEYSREIIDKVFTIERNIEEIHESLDYLKRENADIENLDNVLLTIDQTFHELVHIFSRQEMEFTKKILDSEIQSLKSAVMTKIALVRRLTLLYNLTIFIIIAIASGFLVYNIWIYSRRGKEK